jgi:alpha-tubulin suppressor-like RCC1 family protein
MKRRAARYARFALAASIGLVAASGCQVLLGIDDKTLTQADDGGDAGDEAAAPDAIDVDASSSLSAGVNHTCALTPTGGARCWGYNAFGQLGDGTTTDRSTPVDVSGLTSGVASIVAGGNHTCALQTDGALKCWGLNSNTGALGDGSMVDSAIPVDVEGLGPGQVLQVAAGGAHTCAVVVGGAVRCWGLNVYGQVGDGTTDNASAPREVVDFASGATLVTAGNEHSCALTSDGEVRCWGHDSFDALGNASAGAQSTAPVDVQGLPVPIAFVAASLPDWFTCALSRAGEVACWGTNLWGELGDGRQEVSAGAVAPLGLGGGNRFIAVGGSACAVTAADGLACWGKNEHGDVDQRTTLPVLSPETVPDMLSGVLAVSLGGGQACVRHAGGAGIQCWGNNDHGQLGDNSTDDSLVPVDVVGF